MPESFYRDPLMYQGGAGDMMGPRDPIRALTEDWGIDLEAEVGAITGDVPMGATPAQAAGTIPVSYTHLRAHATVLDLVCRLLLEKTKTLSLYTHCT